MNIKDRWRRWLYAPFFTQLVVIRRCNLHCGYCNEYDSTSNPVAVEVLKTRIGKLKELGAFSICFTGGEPTLHPELCALIKEARYRQRFLRTSMITNGTYLTRDLIEQLNEAGLQDMQISIDGVKRNEMTVKVLDTLRARLGLLKSYARFNVVVSGVIGACPPEESFEVISYAKKCGFRPRVLLVHGADGQVKLNEEELRVYRRIRRLIGWHPFDPAGYRDRIIKDGRAGSRYLYVDEDGIVVWCSQTRDIFRKPLAEYTVEDLQTQFHTVKECHERCSLGCVRAASAFDQWRNQRG